MNDMGVCAFKAFSLWEAPFYSWRSELLTCQSHSVCIWLCLQMVGPFPYEEFSAQQKRVLLLNIF